MGSLFTRLTNYERQLTGGLGKFDVAYGTQEARKTIERWTSTAGWKLNDFGKFLESMGIKTPVVLFEFEKGRKSFKCMSILTGAIYKLRLYHSCELPANCHQIWLTTLDKATSKFSIISSHEESGKIKRKIYLDSKEIEVKKDWLFNEFRYSPFFLEIKYHLQDNTFLHILVNEPNSDDGITATETSHILNPEIPAKIENYLFELDESLTDNLFDAKKVYNKFVEILGYTPEELKRIDRFEIEKKNRSDFEENGEGDIVLAAYCTSQGKLFEFGIENKNGETFLVFSDGCWKYYCEGKKITYNAPRKHMPEHKICKGFEGNIFENEIYERVKKQIDIMMKQVE